MQRFHNFIKIIKLPQKKDLLSTQNNNSFAELLPSTPLQIHQLGIRWRIN